MIIEVSIDRKRKIIEYPSYFEKLSNGYFKRCFTKEQFDYLKHEDITTSYMYFDYKKR